jgi:hypothetical protein
LGGNRQPEICVQCVTDGAAVVRQPIFDNPQSFVEYAISDFRLPETVFSAAIGSLKLLENLQSMEYQRLADIFLPTRKIF